LYGNQKGLAVKRFVEEIDGGVAQSLGFQIVVSVCSYENNRPGSKSMGQEID
jgi:hypothetical protein